MINLRLRKFAARLLLPFLTIWLTVMPTRSYAVLAVIPIAASFALSGGARIAVKQITAAAIGFTLAHFALSKVDSSGNALPGEVRIPVSDAPAMAIPAPAASSSTSATTSVKYSGSINGAPWTGYNYFSQEEACSAAFTLGFPGGTNYVLVGYIAGGPSGDGCYATLPWTGSTLHGIGTVAALNVSGCPTGYVLSGGSCSLANAHAAVSDNNLDYEYSAGAFTAPSSTDADNSSTASNFVSELLASSTITGNSSGIRIAGGGVNGSFSNAPVVYDVEAVQGGGVRIIERASVVSSSGDSGIQTKTISINSAGVIGSVSQTTTTGTISYPSATTSGTVDASQVNVQTGADPIAPSFPSDYARSGEAAAAVVPLVNALTNTTAVADPSDLTATDMPGWGNSFDNLRGWSLPNHVSTCPTGQLDLSSVLGAGKVYAFDAHCQLINDNFAQLRAAMMVVWTIAALFLLLRA